MVCPLLVMHLYPGACIASALCWLLTQPKLLIREEEACAEVHAQPANDGAEGDPGVASNSGIPMTDEEGSPQDEERTAAAHSVVLRLASRMHRPDTTGKQVILIHSYPHTIPRL